jgi:hypothetical protein
MDPVAKRQMWKILSTVAPGRSILLTVSFPTHPSIRSS